MAGLSLRPAEWWTHSCPMPDSPPFHIFPAEWLQWKGYNSPWTEQTNLGALRLQHKPIWINYQGPCFP